MEESQYPLVTFALFAYNQEKYIQQAVEAAFAQDYPNLELIISDDASSDATWQVIRSVTDQYAGPHKLRLNRNQENLGVGGHVNAIMEMAEGELIVAAAGDDISDPGRTRILVDEWLKRGKPPAISSEARLISSEGAALGPFMGYEGRYPRASESRIQSLLRLIEKDECITLGCAAAWRPDVFRVFGALDRKIVHEDNAISFRAWLLGSIAFFNERLLAYRQHDSNIANKADIVITTVEGFRLRELSEQLRFERKVHNLDQHLADLEVAFRNGGFEHLPLSLFARELRARRGLQMVKAHWWACGLPTRLSYCATRLLTGDVGSLAWALPRIFGLSTYCRIRQLLGRLSRMLRLYSRAVVRAKP